ncbi:MAG: diacylglycerol kinase family lipid kinase [Oscillospiraceae bacterium]|nr:diacylglycerol kinase family lipid kinase [Oscillospiraceae bacterium]
MEKKLLFIVNPRAGRTKSRAPLFDAVSVFSEEGYHVRVMETKRRGDASDFAARFGADYDLVVCHGGDGTLNETVNGVMRIEKAKRPPLSYLPGGSTNDFAASLSIPSDPVKAAQNAMRHTPRDLDVGVFGEQNFVYVASFGAFTRTAYRVEQDIKNMFGHFAYLLEGVRDIETLRPYHMKITTDAGEVFDGEYLFGAVSNSTSLAGLMKLPGAAVDLSDGRFELLLVPVPKSPQDLQKLIRAVAYQDYDSSEGLIFCHVRHVVAETQETIPWTLDGEYAPGGERIDIRIEDNGIKMML